MSADVSPPVPLSGPRATLAAVTGAIQKAAQATGASFNYLLATAKVESDLNPNLSMRSSSATGLFQFIEQTWLETMKQAGNALGFGRYADAITQAPSGRYEVADPTVRAEIMKLRKDPAANAAMGGIFTQQNASILASRIGRKPTDGELYIAHFFGPYSAAKVIGMAGSNPTANAAQMFPAAARANRPIFYDRQGNARSVAGVYQELVRRYQVALASSTPAQTGVLAPAVASVAAPPGPMPKPQVLPEVAEQGVPSQIATATPDTAGVTQAFAVANAQPQVQPVPQSGQEGSMFLSLFRTGERRGAVSPAVTELWNNGRLRGSAVEGTSATALAPTTETAGVAPLDLFQDMPPRVRGLFEANK